MVSLQEIANLMISRNIQLKLILFSLSVTGLVVEVYKCKEVGTCPLVAGQIWATVAILALWAKVATPIRRLLARIRPT